MCTVQVVRFALAYHSGRDFVINSQCQPPAHTSQDAPDEVLHMA